jgi:hypothetical protein
LLLKTTTTTTMICTNQGCQIFVLVRYTKTGKKCTKWSLNLPNGLKISRLSLKYSKWPYNV